MDFANRTVLVMAAVLIFTLYFTALPHERVHQLIYHRIGGINSTIGINWIGLYTRANETQLRNLINTSPETYMEIEKLHLLNEIVNYNLVPFEALLCALILIFVYFSASILKELIRMRAQLEELAERKVSE